MLTSVMCPRSTTALALLIVLFAAVQVGAAEQVEPEDPPANEGAKSPWMLLPTLSSNPKLGTSLGALGAYLHTFDEGSRVSIFGVGAQYTTTDSAVAMAISRVSWGADHHRLTAGAVAGLIRNDYDDYLGTGIPLKTDDDMRALFTRYLYRLSGDWFIGGQFAKSNYQVLGASDFDDFVLETLGVRGIEAGGLGAVVMHDSRDNQDMPVDGWMLNANSMAYREAFGGADAYDVYRVDARWFWQHGDRQVIALRNLNQFTRDAPLAANASIQLRGYKYGQYLGQHMSSFEVENRWRLGQRWGANLFAGAACLYGDTGDCGEELYTSWGVGLQWVLKPEAKMVINFELAHAEGDSNAALLKLGYAW